MPFSTAREPLFLCPQCGKSLRFEQPCACGFAAQEIDGVIDLLPAAEAANVQPFLDTYERVRREEQWGGDDLDLPFHAKRHRDIWNIRKRTFRALESAVRSIPRGVALDAGAGNCWLSRYLYQWGFEVIALDINVSAADGLRAGRRFVDEGSAFLRIRASMERMPLESGSIRLLVANASFHYASSFPCVLTEFRRVLAAGGTAAIIDTPFYEDSADGDRMVSERVVEFGKKYGIPESTARKSSYLTYSELAKLAAPLDLKVRIRRVWPGFPRSLQAVRGRLAGRRIAEFPLVLLAKK
jgi:SAM-dependent methyltransferase